MLELPGDTQQLLDGLRRFVEVEVLPREESLATLLSDPRLTYDESGRYVKDVMDVRTQIRMAAAEAGFYQMFVPESLGGGGQGAETLYAVWEDLYHHWGMPHWLAFDAVSHWATGPSELFAEASERVQAEEFQLLMSGEKTLCFALSEPDAGSDIWMMRTSAKREGDGWRINGTKQWMTNGPYADFTMVFAVTDAEAFSERRGGITAFLVSTATVGYQVDSLIKLYGHIGSNEAIVSFTEMFVPDDAIVGTLHNGLQLALSGTTLGRLYNSARSVGLSKWALERAVEYAIDRKTFGQAIIDYQGVSFPLAERSIEVLAAHLMGLHAARLVDAGRPATTEAAMAKMFSTEVAGRTIDQAVQTLGGMGLTSEVHLAQSWQELRAVRIADGSAEILRRLVVGKLRKRDIHL